MNEKIYNDFKSVTKNHTMKVNADNGINRSILFSTDGDSCGHYTLTTWYNHLCISGDYGTFVFQRTDDMFKFFRGDTINPSYWGEKLQSISRWGGYEEYCPKMFEENVLDYVEDQLEDLDEETKKDVLEEIQYDILSMAHDGGVRAYDAVHDFDNEHVSFEDFWECKSDKFSYQYIWCLYAIIEGIKRYDEFKESIPKLPECRINSDMMI